MAKLLQLFRGCVNEAVILLTTIFYIGCTPAINVQSTYDSTANFKTYQTFIWHPAELPPPNQGSGEIQYSTLLDQRIKEAIASEMVKKGLNPSSEAPGLLVAYDIAIATPQEPASTNAAEPGFGYGYSYWYGYRYRYSGTGLQNFRSIEEYAPGSLIIDLIDRNTNQVIWRGALDAEIDPTTLDPDKINRAVARVMAQFPPVPNTAR